MRAPIAISGIARVEHGILRKQKKVLAISRLKMVAGNAGVEALTEPTHGAHREMLRRARTSSRTGVTLLRLPWHFVLAPIESAFVGSLAHFLFPPSAGTEGQSVRVVFVVFARSYAR